MLGNPLGLVEIAWTVSWKSSPGEPLPWGECLMLQDVTTGTLGAQYPQKKLFKKDF